MRGRRKWMLPVMLCGILATIENSALAEETWGQLRTQQLPAEETDPGLAESWYLDRIGIKPLWEKLEESGRLPGEGTVIAVIDTGLASSTTCLNGARWCNERELNGEDGVDDDGNGYVDDIYGLNLANRYTYQTDSVGHGTEVSGLIGMQPGDGGGAGLAYGAKIMPIKVSQDTNYDTDTVIEALQYAVHMGADVINMSFATYDPSDRLEEAVREAAKSCVLVAAAGNESFVTEGEYDDLGYTCKDAFPAAWDCCIGVMAGSIGGGLSEFSNWDQCQVSERKYDIVAPGEMLYTVTKGNRYTTVRGTSYATALVSASVALYRQCMDEEMDAPELTRRFLASMTQQTELFCAGYDFSFPVLRVDGFISERPWTSIEEAGEPDTGGSTEEIVEPETDTTTEQITEPEKEATTEHATEAATAEVTEGATEGATTATTEGATTATTERATETVTVTTTEGATTATTERTAGSATTATTERTAGSATTATTERVTGTATASTERQTGTTEQVKGASLRFGKVSMGQKKLTVTLKHKPRKGKLQVTLSQAQKKNGKTGERICRLSVKNAKASVSWKKLKTKQFRSGKAELRLVWKLGDCRIKRIRKVRLKL